MIVTSVVLHAINFLDLFSRSLNICNRKKTIEQRCNAIGFAAIARVDFLMMEKPQKK